MAKPKREVMGKLFGRWTVVSDDGQDKNGKHVVVAKCSCGTVRSILVQNLVSKQSTSCGCWQKTRASETQKARWASVKAKA